MNFGKVTPVLRIFDEAKAREFYVDFPGFTVDWEHRFEAGLPLYRQVSKGACVLHLSEHHGDCSPGAAIRIETDGLEVFQAELVSKHFKYARPERASLAAAGPLLASPGIYPGSTADEIARTARNPRERLQESLVEGQ
jgi:hypothetical protein